VKTIGIEEFAAWCVQSEWPKLKTRHLDEDEAWRAQMLAEIGRLTAGAGIVGGSGGMNWSFMVSEGSVRAVRPMGEPHSDAVLFRQACDALAVEAGSPAYDVDDCLADQRRLLELWADERLSVDWRMSSPFLRANEHNPASLVLAYAGMARAPSGSRDGWAIVRPDWHEGAIEKDYVRGADGRGQPAWFVQRDRRVLISNSPRAYGVRTTEEDGYNAKTRRPVAGAYRKVVYDPDPGFVARARHIYAVWWCSLEWIAAWLEASGALSNHQVKGPQGLEQPWKLELARSA
jgi:hypothetical protein